MQVLKQSPVFLYKYWLHERETLDIVTPRKPLSTEADPLRWRQSESMVNRMRINFAQFIFLWISPDAKSHHVLGRG